ncbi:MAG: hypothetical protein GX142_01335 [Chloroflexi bacterium]|nr:hypothetical protein [Chloroflexota bacterium]
MQLIKSPVWSGHWAPEPTPDLLPGNLFMPYYITNSANIENINSFWLLVFKFHKNAIKGVGTSIIFMEEFAFVNRIANYIFFVIKLIFFKNARVTNGFHEFLFLWRWSDQ